MSRQLPTTQLSNEPVIEGWDADESIGRYLRFALITIAILLVGFGGWAAFASISGAVIAQGNVAVLQNSKSIQHLQGGIVAEILIQDGDVVAKGDLLIQLDSGQLREQIVGLSAAAASKLEQLALVQDELDGLQKLFDKGLVPKTRISALQREAAKLRGEREGLISDAARIKTELSRLQIKAPVEGFIHNLAIHTVGGVVQPGAELMQIVPANAQLMIEAKVDPRDIDQIHNGQDASVRFSSFNSRTTPELKGVVNQVSADLATDEQTGVRYYIVRINLSEEERNKLEGREILPGMPADAFIQTEARSALSYLVQPLTDQVARAFREE
ncbi:MAG: HlyD family efflux transporter periplasmic adaptor subunit [Stappiaceae bacterium]